MLGCLIGNVTVSLLRTMFYLVAKRPAAALEAARAGQITLLPPTAVTLAELAAYPDVGGILGERRLITPLMPTVVVEDERAWLAMPEATEYPL